MKLWRLILPVLLFGALWGGSTEESSSVVPTLRASAYASEMEEAFVAVCEHIGSMPCELPLLRTSVGVEWGGSSRTLSVRPCKWAKIEGGVRARGGWSPAVAGSYHLAFFAEPRPLEQLRVLRRLRI